MDEATKRRLAQEAYNQRMEKEYEQMKNKKPVKQKKPITKKEELTELTEKQLTEKLYDSKKKSDKTREKLIKEYKTREKLIKEFDNLKEEYHKVDNDETLRKYNILSKAYTLGKEIYGVHYTIAAMSVHFDIPYETCRRVMSLSRASEKIWKLINDGKLSAFKAAQICLTINKSMRDEIVDTVIKDDLSTYQIKRMDLPNKGLIKKERLKVSVEKGYSRQDAAYRSVRDTVERMESILELKKEHFSPGKMPEIIMMLTRLRDLIDEKTKEWTIDEGE